MPRAPEVHTYSPALVLWTLGADPSVDGSVKMIGQANFLGIN